MRAAMSPSLPPRLPPTLLSHAELDTVIRLAPLIAIDLIIRNARDEVLLGLRKNEPAKGCYFVPGGVILKNERLAEAFARLIKNETDHAARLDDARLSACTSISTTTSVPATADMAPITSCSAMNFDGRPQQCRGPTTSIANCVGGPWPSYWRQTACMRMPRPISARAENILP
jgi:hypothetical protein